MTGTTEGQCEDRRPDCCSVFAAHTNPPGAGIYELRAKLAAPGNTTNRKESVRFDSFRFRTFQNSSARFGSVREVKFPGSTQLGLRFSDASWLDPVRFDTFPRPVPPGSRVKQFGSVQFGRCGSVSYSFLQ